MSFLKLTDILKQAQKRFPGLAKRLDEAQALGRWEIAVGPAIAKHSRALRVQDGMLWVEVDHPIWKSELHHRKRQILEILNKTADSQTQPGARLGPDSFQDLSKNALLTDIFFTDIGKRY
jgi:predicted nucleic acid-binding Zn ribbon protein